MRPGTGDGRGCVAFTVAAHLDRSFSDSGYRIPQPLTVAREQLALVELEAQLAGKQRQLRDDRVAHAPVGVGAQLVDRGHHACAQPLIAEDLLGVMQALDDVEPYLWHLHTHACTLISVRLDATSFL